MEFLDNFVIPQSSEHIQLLHYILILLLFLFIPFISLIFGGTVLSLYYKKKGLDERNSIYLRFSKDIIETVTINKSIGIIIGIVPLFTSLIIFIQLLHNSNASVVTYLLFSFIFASIGLILIYTYRYSLSFNNIFDAIKDFKTDDQFLHQDIMKFRRGSLSLSFKSGRYGIFFLFISLWLFISGITLATYPDQWGSENLIKLLFSWSVIFRYLNFIFASFAITAGAILFSFFYWEGGRAGLEETYKEFVKKTTIKIAFIFSLFIPLFLFINVITLPEEILSSSVFGYSAIALCLIFLSYHFLYAMIKSSSVKYSAPLFFMILFTIMALIVKDQLAMSNATEVQSQKLNLKFEEYLASLKGENKITAEEISGEKIYQNICASCHRFDLKLVGPAYETVLPKYEGKIDQLVSFIRNPAKVDPVFPPMPNPGLRPNEAKAIADYEMITHMKNVFGQRISVAGENGEQIFKMICSACHSFEKDMVGPAFNSVVSKYVGNEQNLITFLSNPQKMNPKFPQMPNPQLKEGQMRAIATYVLNEFNKRKPL